MQTNFIYDTFAGSWPASMKMSSSRGICQEILVDVRRRLSTGLCYMFQRFQGHSQNIHVSDQFWTIAFLSIRLSDHPKIFRKNFNVHTKRMKSNISVLSLTCSFPDSHEIFLKRKLVPYCAILQAFDDMTGLNH